MQQSIKKDNDGQSHEERLYKRLLKVIEIQPDAIELAVILNSLEGDTFGSVVCAAEQGVLLLRAEKQKVENERCKREDEIAERKKQLDDTWKQIHETAFKTESIVVVIADVIAQNSTKAKTEVLKRISQFDRDCNAAAYLIRKRRFFPF